MYLTGGDPEQSDTTSIAFFLALIGVLDRLIFSKLAKIGAMASNLNGVLGVLLPFRGPPDNQGQAEGRMHCGSRGPSRKET